MAKRPHVYSEGDDHDVEDLEWFDEQELFLLLKNPLVWIIFVLAGILIWVLTLQSK